MRPESRHRRAGADGHGLGPGGGPGLGPPLRTTGEGGLRAGPTGYVLARHLREAGIGCVVAASSKLLCAPGDYPEDFVVPGFCRFAFALLVFVGSYSG